MPAYIHHIATQTPVHRYAQSHVRDRLKGWADDERTRRMIHAVYQRSGIETRYSVLPDFHNDSGGKLFGAGAEQGMRPRAPGTAERNRVFGKEARTLSASLGRRLIAESEFTPSQITHLVFATCTGFANPGPDFHLIQDLGLVADVERYTLGFMGCYAAFPALRMAAQFCEANAEAVVLVMCLELCTLHMQLDGHTDSLLANSLFADGAGAALLSGRAPKSRAAFQVKGFHSSVVPNSESHMAWEIGNEGFNIILSSYVPDVLGTELRPLLVHMLEEEGMRLTDIEKWAVHPGGRSILDKVTEGLALSPDALDVSREVLRQYGNMSSATILFVLQAMLNNAETADALVCAMAFGPGLTLETVLLERCVGSPTQSGQRTSISLPAAHHLSAHVLLPEMPR